MEIAGFSYQEDWKKISNIIKSWGPYEEKFIRILSVNKQPVPIANRIEPHILCLIAIDQRNFAEIRKIVRF